MAGKPTSALRADAEASADAKRKAEAKAAADVKAAKLAEKKAKLGDKTAPVEGGVPLPETGGPGNGGAGDVPSIPGGSKVPDVAGQDQPTL